MSASGKLAHLFANQAQTSAYTLFRPTYPEEIYAIIERFTGCPSSGVAPSTTAVDVGCGSGQATLALAQRGTWANVYGIDPSPAQLQHAAAAPNIRYSQGTAEATGLPDGSCDLYTCAQALHWCDPVGVYTEAARVLRRPRAQASGAQPGAEAEAGQRAGTGGGGGDGGKGKGKGRERGGVVAVWGYDMATIEPLPGDSEDPTALARATAATELKRHLYATVLGPAHWDSNRYKLDRRFTDAELAPPGRPMEADEAAQLGLTPVDGVAALQARVAGGRHTAAGGTAGSRSMQHVVARSPVTGANSSPAAAVADPGWTAVPGTTSANAVDCTTTHVHVPGNGEWFHRVARWDGHMKATWTLHQVMGYIRSWSGYTTYLKRHGIDVGAPGDPALPVLRGLTELYSPGRPEAPPEQIGGIVMNWPLFMLLAERTHI